MRTPHRSCCGGQRAAKTPSAAFTLIELLMVITIISILMSILFVVINLVREQTYKTICASHLHNWGMAFSGYAQENRGQIPKTTHHFLHAPTGNSFWMRPPHLVDPTVLRVTNPAYEYCRVCYLPETFRIRHRGEIDMETMSQYLPNRGSTVASMLDLPTNTVSMPDVWNCASARWKRTANYMRQEDRVFMNYQYFAGMDRTHDMSGSWYAGATAGGNRPWSKSEFHNGTTFMPGRVLMSDELFNYLYYPSTAGGRPDPRYWVFNHRKGGNHAKDWYADLSKLGGINQLWGDLRVAWAPASKFVADDMTAMRGKGRIWTSDLLYYVAPEP